MASQAVTYELDGSTTVQFEMEPTDDFRNVGAGNVIGRVREAVTPAVEAAKVVLDKMRETQPDQVEVKFGVKVSGKTDWLVAKAATEGNFEVTLTWKPQPDNRPHTSADGG